MDGDASDVVKHLETDLVGLKTKRALICFLNSSTYLAIVEFAFKYNFIVHTYYVLT